MLAAGFLYWATKLPVYKIDAETWADQLLSTTDPSTINFSPSYDNNYWAANAVMYHTTHDKRYLQVSTAILMTFLARVSRSSSLHVFCIEGMAISICMAFSSENLRETGDAALCNDKVCKTTAF